MIYLNDKKYKRFQKIKKDFNIIFLKSIKLVIIYVLYVYVLQDSCNLENIKDVKRPLMRDCG